MTSDDIFGTHRCQAGLVALDREHVVPTPTVQVLGVLTLGMQRVRVRIAPLTSMLSSSGALVRLAVHDTLGEHHAVAVIERCQQVPSVS